ncbi:hypothetical protein K2173_006580 [Erythroxylum novogranatense]|uniref:MADS-box domain-containing protein n=1 Tax=Erythroxylum novogranatense TaxID=1862640 RepID=A0AAV8T707_9ROSI|nr:hypothetical protein K2173_006580 [Erythroxylum novogranatense]
MASQRVTKGKQKIEIKRIEDENNRLVSFSKRRNGIFKKASDLVTLTGSQVAVGLYSPSGKLYSYGHPSLDAAATRFLGREPAPTPNEEQTQSILDAHRQMRIDQLIQLYNEAVKEVEFESGRSREVKQRLTGVEAKGWWSGGMEEFDVQELFQLHAALGDIESSLRTAVEGRRLPVYGAPFSVSVPPMNDVGVYPMNSYSYPFATIANETSGSNPTNVDFGGHQQL